MISKYFVLDPRGRSRHANASREAMRTYAEFISDKSPNVAAEIVDWVEQEACDADRQAVEDVNRKNDLEARFNKVASYLNSRWFPHRSPEHVTRAEAREQLARLHSWFLGGK